MRYRVVLEKQIPEPDCPGLPLTSWGTLGKLPDLFLSQFVYPCNVDNNSTYLIRLQEGVTKLIFVKCFKTLPDT